MVIWDSRQAAISLVSSILLCILLLILVSDAALPKIHWVWPFLVASGFYYATMRRSLKRRYRLREPFPEAWRALLRNYVGYYNRLPPKEQAAFEKDVQIFLIEHTITGVGVEVTDLL